MVRPHSKHIDMPEYFYTLPFHYISSSVLVEAWFAAPSIAERRRLINWPPSIDVGGLYPLRIDKLWDFYEIPERFFRRTGGGNSKIPRLHFHPAIKFLYDMIKKAICHDSVRVQWKVRHNSDIATASSPLERQQILRRLYLSLIVGELHEIRNYRPPGAVCAYTHSPSFIRIDCVPVCYQQHDVSHVSGHSLPVRGPGPHPPRFSIYEGVLSLVTTSRAAEARGVGDTPVNLRRLAHTAMAEAATVWAREYIDNTRDPACPAEYFPQLEHPAIAVAEDADAHFPVARPAAYFSEDEADAGGASPPSSDDD